MVARNLAPLFALALFALAACGGAPPTEDTGDSNSAITGSMEVGASVQTTARVNLRTDPVIDPDNIIETMPLNATVVIEEAQPTGGFYHVSFNGDDGWASGQYLKGATAAPAEDDDPEGAAAPAAPTADGTPTGVGETCKASFYDTGSQTADGEHFDPNGLTAAHKTLKFNTRLRVTNTANGKSVVVRVNDRGPFVAGRCLDLARGAFQQIGSTSAGVLTVHYDVLQ